MISAFLLSLTAVVLAEMGDKTQLLAMAFASKYRWQTVMWAVFAATLVNHLMAVAVGNVITHFIPVVWIKLMAAVSFVLFGLWTIRGDQYDGEENRRAWSPFWTVAVAFFIAEMGDKTQLMTIALAADEAVKIGGTGWLAKLQQMVPVWMGSTCGMMIADAVGIIVGIVLHRHIPEKLVKWTAALAFIGFGLLGIHEALDIVLAAGATWHHPLLLISIPGLASVMWLVARATANSNPSRLAENRSRDIS